MEIRTVALCLSCVIVAVLADDDDMTKKAKCEVEATTGATGSPGITGTVYFEKMDSNVKVSIDLSGFTGTVGDKHGFHVHKTGNISNGCLATEGHYNPDGVNHGARTNPATTRHVGDLGNIVEEAGGVVKVNFTDSIITLEGAKSIIGRAIVIHAGEDDLGLVGDEGSRTTGNAGARHACCVIEEDDDDPNAGHNVMYSVTALVTSALVTMAMRL